MDQTKLTPQVLRSKGFEEIIMCGHIYYVKDNKYAIVYSIAWIPCRMENNNPVSTNVCINTWEEFERLIKEGTLE